MTPAGRSSRPVALVTGSARRIGAEIARTLHAAGYDLALHCRHSREELDALASGLETLRPGSTMTHQADLADVGRLQEMVEHTLARYGRLDALVNNASTFHPTPVGSATPQQWEALFASNARAPFFLAQAAAPHLAATQGAIVNLVDIYAERPLRGHTLYCMAKAALVMMTRSLAVELAPDVRVNAVAPGAILWPDNGATGGPGAMDGTGAIDGPTPAQRAMVERTPLRRTGTAEEIAEAVRWLLQDARYTTGEVLHVDGGRLLGI